MGSSFRGSVEYIRVILWHLTEESRVSIVAEIVTFDVGRRGALSSAVTEDGHE